MRLTTGHTAARSGRLRAPPPSGQRRPEPAQPRGLLTAAPARPASLAVRAAPALLALVPPRRRALSLCVHGSARRPAPSRSRLLGRGCRVPADTRSPPLKGAREDESASVLLRGWAPPRATLRDGHGAAG